MTTSMMAMTGRRRASASSSERQDAGDAEGDEQRRMGIDPLPPGQHEEGGGEQDDEEAGDADEHRAVVFQEVEEPGGH